MVLGVRLSCLAMEYFIWGSLRVTIAVMKHQSNLGKKRFIQLTLPYHSSSSAEVRIGAQAGQEAELMQRPQRNAAYQLASRGLPSYRSQEHLPRADSTHNELDPLINHYSRKYPTGLPPEVLWGGLSVDTSSSGDSGCVRLT